jgi:hypothetical protein
MIEMTLFPQQHARDGIDYLIAFAPLLAIFVAVFVAIVQARLQRQQLKQHLFEKRFDVYTAVGVFINHLIYRKWVDPNDFINLRSQFTNARYLFDSSVRRQMCEIYSKAERYMILLDKARSQQGVSFENVVLTPELQELRKWLVDTAPRSIEKSFDDHLQVQPEKFLVRCQNVKDSLEQWMQTMDDQRSAIRTSESQSTPSQSR